MTVLAQFRRDIDYSDATITLAPAPPSALTGKA
ncbi:MAG: hypothetical protein JWO28_1128, partial [Hyphomicrobiales bacterium]|nr:hypothetical protein [Hyphomicrobiales bacterium]